MINMSPYTAHIQPIYSPYSSIKSIFKLRNSPVVCVLPFLWPCILSITTLFKLTLISLWTLSWTFFFTLFTFMMNNLDWIWNNYNNMYKFILLIFILCHLKIASWLSSCRLKLQMLMLLNRLFISFASSI